MINNLDFNQKGAYQSIYKDLYNKKENREME